MTKKVECHKGVCKYVESDFHYENLVNDEAHKISNDLIKYELYGKKK